MKSELSKKNPYWIEKHRYYELKHFCLQYPIWKKLYLQYDGITRNYYGDKIQTSEITDSVYEATVKREVYFRKMELIEQSAMLADRILYPYIVKGVTEGYSYDSMRAQLNIPCCRETYYILYRKFFYILSSRQ